MLLKDKNVIITGATRGIGKGIALEFAKQGANIAFTYSRSVNEAKDLEKELSNFGVKAKSFQSDASNYDDSHKLIESILLDFDTIDVLVNNAGIAGPTAVVEDIELSDWQRCVSVNLEGAFLAAKYGGPMLKETKGAIVLTSSTAGIYGFPNRAPYAAAKWAIIGLMKTLAMEWGPSGVRANAICPGAVEGPRMQGVMEREATAKGTSYQNIYEGYAAGNSMQSLVTAGDIAKMATFLCGSGARMVSGQVIAVDGHTENPDPKV